MDYKNCSESEVANRVMELFNKWFTKGLTNDEMEELQELKKKIS